jgi:hypothetical protein
MISIPRRAGKNTALERLFKIWAIETAAAIPDIVDRMYSMLRSGFAIYEYCPLKVGYWRILFACCKACGKYTYITFHGNFPPEPTESQLLCQECFQKSYTGNEMISEGINRRKYRIIMTPAFRLEMLSGKPIETEISCFNCTERQIKIKIYDSNSEDAGRDFSKYSWIMYECSLYESQCLCDECFEISGAGDPVIRSFPDVKM